MKETTLVSRFRSALHERFDTIAREPLPKRWVDLIKELNERERRGIETQQRRKPEKARTH